MSLRSPLGSMSALSLGGGQVSIPMLAAAGVAVTVAAAAFTYRAYKKYEEKKHRKEIEAINSLHNKYLAKIPIFDYSEIQGFPIIYKLTDDKDSSKAESLHYNDEEIDDIGKTLPHGSDIALANYRESVLNAILKLKEYYFERKDHDDITGGVLSYLLNMLQTKCLNFEGYEYDIAYLNALARFVNAYASMEGRENSQHFTRMNPVYEYLLSAKQALERHREKLSLDEMFGELRDACLHENNLLIRSFAQLINKNSDWGLLKTVTHDEMSQGLLRRQYVHNEVIGLVLRKDNQVVITKSIFRDWLVHLSKYYLDTLDADCPLKSQDMLAPDFIFRVPDLNYLNELRQDKKKLNKQQEREWEKLENEMKEIRKLFATSKNFVTTELDVKTVNKTTKFVSITDEHKIIERSKVLAQFATLMHRMVSLQYLSSQILKSTRQLGEIYVKNPSHFRWVFTVLNQLTRQILDGIDDFQKTMTAIQQASQNNMQLLDKELFPQEIRTMLTSATATISKLSMQINVYRDKVNKGKDPNEPTVQSVKHEMFEVATSLSTMYHIMKPPKEAPHDDKPAVEPVPADKEVPPVVTTSDNKHLPPHKDMNQMDANELLEALAEGVDEIESDEKLEVTAREMAAYRGLLNSLIAFHAKAAAMNNENDISAERAAKARKIMSFTSTLCTEALEFIHLPRTDRLQAGASFHQHVSDELASADNRFMDEHKNKFLKGVYSICHISLFNTDTRKRASKIGKACSELAKLTAG